MILKINNIITIQLDPGIEATDGDELLNPFCWYFTTEMTPLCASAFDVRRLVGAFVTEIPDDVINQLILEFSLCAQDLADCPIDDRWKRYSNKWVAYKVAMVILYNTEDFRGETSDKVFKQLGDFSVSKQGGSASGTTGVSRMIEWLECEAFKLEHSVRFCVPPALNCLGLTDNSAVPYMALPPGLTELGLNDPNRPFRGRRWVTDILAAPRGNNMIFKNKRWFHTNIGTRNIF